MSALHARFDVAADASSWEVVERRRIEEHLLGAERFARSRDLSELSAEQRTVRALLLEELAVYRADGRFPRNPEFDAPTPYFIDAAGTRCAMAHLMEIGGAGDLVAEIAATRNNAYVDELAEDARVLAWLDAAGLAPEEAARIQPEYCRTTVAECLCRVDRFEPAAGVARGILKANDAGQPILVVREIALAGEACSALRVGDELEVSDRFVPEGSELAVTLAPSAKADGGATCLARQNIVKTTNGTTTCMDGWFADYQVPSNLSTAEILAALSASDCSAHLQAMDPAWTAPPAPCDNSAAPFDCNVGSVRVFDALSTSFVLAAVLAYRARRRSAGMK